MMLNRIITQSLQRLILFVVLVGTYTIVYANNGTTTKKYYYYAQLTAKSSGNGKVYASVNEASTDAATLDSSTAGPKQDPTSYGNSAPDNGSAIFYVYAKAAEGYKFDGWSESSSRPTSFLSVDAAYTYSVSIAKPTSTVTSAPSSLVNATETESNMSGDETVYYSKTTSKTLYAYFSEKVNAVITLSAASGGTYTYSCLDGSGTISTETQVISTQEEVTLVANPSEGNKFYGWYTLNGDVENYLSYSSTFTKAFDGNTTIYAKFIPAESAIFTIKGTSQYYYDFNAAIVAAQSSSSKVIVPTNDGSILPGTYTIPAEVTLLVPMDADFTTMTMPEEKTSWSALKQYRKLALSQETNIIVQGSICVAGSQFGASSSNPGPGSINGAYGVLDMSQGGSITISNGARLYAFGFIIGAGDQSTAGIITIKSGGVVYEDLVINDMRGGGGTAACVNGTDASNDYGVFPFSQYYVQNIEPRMTIEYGGIEYAYYDISSSFGGKHDKISFIGSTNSFLFQLASTGYITKWYDTLTDYQCYEIGGQLSMNSITVYATDNIALSSNNFILPINNNMSITVANNATFNLPYDIKFLPGAKVLVKEGAVVNAQKSIYVYDAQDWDKYASQGYAQTFGLATAGYKLPWHTLRAVANLSDFTNATFIINGTLHLGSSAKFYTTSHGSSITSTGSGKIVYDGAAPTTNTNLYEIYGNYGKSSTGGFLGQDATSGMASDQKKIGSFSFLTKSYTVYGTPVACTPAQLLNADGTYVATSGTTAGTTYTYCEGEWGIGSCSKITISYEGGTYGIGTITSDTINAGEEHTLSSETFTREGYTQTGWSINEDGSTKDYELGAIYNGVENITLYPYWTANTHNLAWDAAGGVLSGDYTQGVVEVGTPITAPTATRTGYDFNGWDELVPATMPDDDLTFVAQWEIKTYNNVSFNSSDETMGTVTASPDKDSYSYGEEVTVTATANEGYSFDGWSNGETSETITVVVDENTGAIVANFKPNTDTKYIVRHLKEALTGEFVQEGADEELRGTTGADVTPEPLTFEGFTTPSAQTKKIAADGSLVIEYRYVRNSYSLTWNANGGEFTNSGYTEGQVKYEAEIIPAQVARKGYEFLGWGATVPSKMPAGTLNFIADWQKEKYTGVNIPSGQQEGGVVTVSPDQDEYSYEDAITISAIPDAGYEFSGWSDGNNDAERTIIISGDTTITATFTAKTNIAYQVYHMQQNITDDEYTEKEIENLTGTTGTQTAATAKTYEGFELVPFEQKIIDGDDSTKVYIYYNRYAYAIRFLVEGVEMQSDILRFDATPEYNGETPAKAADAQFTYTFNGWDPAIAKVSQAQDYKAKFSTQLNQYTVSFNANGHGTAPVPQSVGYGQLASEPSAPSETGYTFGGWYKEASCTNAWNFANDVIEGNVELFAKWTVNVHSLTWNLNGGAITSAAGDYTAAGNVAFGTALVAPVVERTGFKFTDWNPSVESTMPDEDVTYEAQWEEVVPTSLETIVTSASYPIYIYDANGRLEAIVRNQEEMQQLKNLTQGFYILRMGNAAHKLIIRY